VAIVGRHAAPLMAGTRPMTVRIGQKAVITNMIVRRSSDLHTHNH
jgi:hypothetical protein